MLFFRKFVLVLLVMLSFAPEGYSQKRVKYKDLFPILQSKDFRTAEPLLLQYLSDNQDEANPHFYLGEILTAKLDSTAIFPIRISYDSLANKAIQSYKKAISLVDDREVRKNDEFYIAYNRRDLRTGKFGIKVADIHLDYENKIAVLTEKTALVDQIYEQASKVDSLVNTLNTKIESLQKQFTNEKAFLLRSTSEDYLSVAEANNLFTRLKTTIDEYIRLLEVLKSANKAPEITIETVNKWSSLRAQEVDLLDKQVNLKDYQSYLSLLLIKIEDEIVPLKALLLQTDQTVNDLIEENMALEDSSQIKLIEIPAKLEEELTGLNAGALPLKVLSYKKLKNEAQLLQNTSLFPVLLDSTNVFQNVKLLKKQTEVFEEMKQLLALIDKFANEENKLNYQFYLNRFEPSFEGYLNTEITLTDNRLQQFEKEYRRKEMLSKIFIFQLDTIYSDSTSAIANQSFSFATKLQQKDDFLLIAGQKNDFPFIGKALFNMNIEKLQILPDTAQVINILQINNNILLNTAFTNKSDQFKISSFNQQLELMWDYEFSANLPVTSAKEEAGILFLYNKEGEVVKTLNSKGKEIGN